MRHPLVNCSLTPHEIVFPYRLERQRYQSSNGLWVNEELVIVRLWEQANRISSDSPLPLTTIIHNIVPSIAPTEKLEHGDFAHAGLPYDERDIRVLTSTLQWFGTNVGRELLVRDISDSPQFTKESEFILKAGLFDCSRNSGAASFWVHVCTQDCAVSSELPLRVCPVRKNEATNRDRVVIQGLMWWLGSVEGRRFLGRFAKVKRRLWRLVDTRSREKQSA